MADGLINYNKDNLQVQADNIKKESYEKTANSIPEKSGTGTMVDAISEMVKTITLINEKTKELAESVSNMLETMGLELENADENAANSIGGKFGGGLGL